MPISAQQWRMKLPRSGPKLGNQPSQPNGTETQDLFSMLMMLAYFGGQWISRRIGPKKSQNLTRWGRRHQPDKCEERTKTTHHQEQLPTKVFRKGSDLALLAIGGVESNPGPPPKNSQSDKVTGVNVDTPETAPTKVILQTQSDQATPGNQAQHTKRPRIASPQDEDPKKQEFMELMWATMERIETKMERIETKLDSNLQEMEYSKQKITQLENPRTPSLTEQ